MAIHTQGNGGVPVTKQIEVDNSCDNTVCNCIFNEYEEFIAEAKKLAGINNDVSQKPGNNPSYPDVKVLNSNNNFKQ